MSADKIIARVELKNGWSVNFVEQIIDNAKFFVSVTFHGANKVGSSGAFRGFDDGLASFFDEVSATSKW